MKDASNIHVAQAPSEGIAGSSFDRPDQLFEGEVNWGMIVGGIIVAGGVYPVVLIFIGLFIGLVRLLLYLVGGSIYTIGPSEIIIVPFLAGICAAIGGVVGVLWTAVVSLFVVPVSYLFVRSMRLRVSAVWLSAVCGGVVGFVAVLPLMPSLILPTVTNSASGVIMMFALGPGLTTILGQLGGAWGGKRSMQLSSEPRRNTILGLAGGWQRTKGISMETAESPDSEKRPPLQFRIRHLLWMSVWLSILLTAIRLIGIPFELILPILLGWLVYQSATLYSGWLIARRLWPRWRASRESRST